MTQDFMTLFTENNCDAQNPLLNADQFVDRVREYGMSIDKITLESLARQKLLIPIIKSKPPKDTEFHISKFTRWGGDLPSYDPIKSRRRKTAEYSLSFYSSFQIHWLKTLLESLILRISFLKENPAIEAQLMDGYKFNIEKVNIRKQYLPFHKFVQFLILIQPAYYPYFQSGGKRISMSDERNIPDQASPRHRKSIRDSGVLAITQISHEDVLSWYCEIAERAEIILGGGSYDWIQLWKNISWDKKKQLKGHIRLGVDYLQWALMLKRFLADDLDREIPDVDEIHRWSAENILDINLGQWGGTRSLRHFRNWVNLDLTSQEHSDLQSVAEAISGKKDKKTVESKLAENNPGGFYIDRKLGCICFKESELEVKNLNKNHYKSLYYLSNDFGINYQPKVLAFVEGETEEEILPRLFRFCIGDPDTLGIEFMSIEGINNWAGGMPGPKRLNKTQRNIAVSRFKNLITYNLRKWQILPFLIADDEGGILDLIQKSEVARLQGEDIPLSKNSELVYIWGYDNANKPFKGKDFETANFSNREIVKAMNKVLLPDKLQKRIQHRDIQTVRDNELGITQIFNGCYKEVVQAKKREIVRELLNGLENDFHRKKLTSNQILKRPFCKMFDILTRTAVLNHSPANRMMEAKNEDAIKELFQKSGKS